MFYLERWIGSLCVVFALGACGSDSTSADGTESDSSSSTTGTTMQPTAAGPTTGPSTTGPVFTTDTGTTDGTAEETGPPTGTDSGTSSSSSSGSSGSSDSTSSSGSSDGSTSGSSSSSSSGDTTVGNPLLPNGAQCNQNDECESDACYIVGILGGICGECLEDADCPGGGCTTPAILDTPPEGAICNGGFISSGCETDEACYADLVCAEIYDIPGVITLNTCSDCVDDSDCLGQHCTPIYLFPGIDGYKTCEATGAVPDGGGCDLDGTGDEACASGVCSTADVMGLLQLGICGECESDADCPGQTCQAAVVDFTTGPTASVCV